MPWAAIIPAVVGAGGAIAGAEIAKSGTEDAASQQAAAAQRAAQLQEEALQLKAQQYNNALKLAQQQWAANQNIRAGLLKRYGVNVPAADLAGGAAVQPINLAQLTSLGAGAPAGSSAASGTNPLALAAAGVGGLSLASLWNNGLPGNQNQIPQDAQIPLAGPTATAQPIVAPQDMGGVQNIPTLADLSGMQPSAGAY